MKRFNEYITEENKDEEKIIKELISFYTKSDKSPSDKEYHKLAEKLKVETDYLESLSYKIIHMIIRGGLSSNFKGEFDEKELKMGIEIEKEHMYIDKNDKKSVILGDILSEKISKDHISEISNYYSLLKKMEKDAEE